MAETALQKLQQSLARQESSVLSRIEEKAQPTRNSALVVDCSYSMNSPISSGGRRVDAMRKVVAELRKTNSVPLIGFGTRGKSVQRIDEIPDPAGGTPMAEAIEFTKAEKFDHMVLVSDGEPPNEGEVLEAAAKFGGPIDTFYIGERHSRGAIFMAELARATGGQSGVTDLSAPKELAGKITLLIGDGSTVPAKKGAIRL